MAKKWIQAAVKKMKKKGTLGSYGKSTEAKNKKNMSKGGKIGKKARFAENMRKIAAKHKRDARGKRMLG